MNYVVYVKNNFDGSYETGKTFEKVSDAVRYAESIEKLYAWVYCVMSKLTFTK